MNFCFHFFSLLPIYRNNALDNIQLAVIYIETLICNSLFIILALLSNECQYKTGHSEILKNKPNKINNLNNIKGDKL